MRQGLGGMPHATVFRGPQVQESQESVSEVGENRFVGTHSINTTNSEGKKFIFSF